MRAVIEEISWFDRQELRAHLSAYPPIGLSLRAYFHARTTADPATWYRHQPATVSEPGLGTALVFQGLCDSVPFEISALRHRYDAWGFEVRLPDPIDDDARSIETVAKLCLPRWTHPYFDSIPVPAGFAVVEVGDTTPIYASRHRTSAEAAVRLLNAVEPGKYEIASLTRDEPAWVVFGPTSGPCYAAVTVHEDEQSARRLATAETERTGTAFTIARVG